MFIISVSLAKGVPIKESGPLRFFNDIKSKLKVKVHYNEGPSDSDFFSTLNFSKYKYISLGALEKLNGSWVGTYQLSNESLSWINPAFEKQKIYKEVRLGTYKLLIGFAYNSNKRQLQMNIVQEDVKYGFVNLNILKDNKQINYWAKASSLNWVEIIRGKIKRLNDKELYTEFQTVVYEGKTPLYAFKGGAILTKVLDKGL